MLRFLMSLSGLFAFFFSVQLHAQQTATCISKEEMQEIARDFSQFEPYANDRYCLDGSEISNLLDSLLFMRKTSFQPPLENSQDELFSGRFKDDWYGYFTGRISGIEIDRGCPKGVGAYVYGFSDKMYVCTMLLTADFTSLDRASVFMHEARHIDGFPHTTCRSGARAGIRGACDYRISDGGSYAVSVETYAQIARYATEVHPALRAYSRAAAVTYADEAFVTPAQVDRTSGLVVLSSDRTFYQVSKTATGQLYAKALGQAPHLGTVIPRAEQLILFPSNKTKLAGYVFPRGEGEISQQAGELPRKYNEMSADEKAKVIDSHIAGQWTAQIKGHQIEFSCDYRSDSVTHVNLPQGKEALGFVYPQGYNRANETLLVSFADGSLYEAGCENSRQAFIRDSGQSYSIPMKRVHRADSLILGVDLAGSLYEIVNGQPQLIHAAGIDFAFEIAPYSSFDFFDL